MKQILLFLTAISLCTTMQAYKVTVQNETNYTLRVKTNYMGESKFSCRPDIFTLKPQERKEINSGGCLLIGIKAAGFTAGPERLTELKDDNHNEWYKIADIFTEPAWVDKGKSLGSADFMLIQRKGVEDGNLSKGNFSFFRLTSQDEAEMMKKLASKLRLDAEQAAQPKPAPAPQPAASEPAAKPSQEQLDEKLASAVGYEDITKIQEALKAGANINSQRGFMGSTPLTYAASMGKIDLIKFLIGAGANVNATDKNGRTALMRVSLSSDATTIDMIELLIAAGADINYVSKKDPFDESTAWKRLNKYYPILAYNPRILKAFGFIKEAAPAAPETDPMVTLSYAVLGLKPGASDAQILGLTQEQLRDAAAVRKAYLGLSRTWHPDKRSSNARYSQDDVKNLSDSEKETLSNEVFKLIGGAYGRNK